MGVWGPAIFSDDTASDIRNEYRELLEDQVPDEESTQRILHRYQDLDDDEVHVLWLALAAAQQQAGRLEDRVRDEALRIIDTGEGLEYWAEEADDGDGADLKKRKAALQALRTKLTAPQPSRKKIRRPYRPTTDLVPGDLLSYTPEQGATLVFRVIGIESNRHFEAPVMQSLDWSEHTAPTFDQAVALPNHPGAPGRTEVSMTGASARAAAARRTLTGRASACSTWVGKRTGRQSTTPITPSRTGRSTPRSSNTRSPRNAWAAEAPAPR